MPGFEPQTDIHTLIIPGDGPLMAAPLGQSEQTLLAVPLGVNAQYDLVSISWRAHVLPVDGSNDVHVDIEYIAPGVAAVNLVVAYDLEDDTTVLVVNEVFRGSQIMDVGDVINVEYDVTTPDTASSGAAWIVEYRVLRHS